MSTKAKERVTSQFYFWEHFFPRPGDRSTLRDVLKKNVLFQELTKDELRYLERVVHIRRYETGEYVFHQNERALGMYIITTGKVNVVVNAADGHGLKLKEAHVTSLGEGAFLGEHSLIEVDALRTASTIASEPTTLIAFLKPDLMDIVQRRPIMGLKITLQLAKVLSMRLRKTTEKLTELSTEIEARDEAEDRKERKRGER